MTILMSLISVDKTSSHVLSPPARQHPSYYLPLPLDDEGSDEDGYSIFSQKLTLAPRIDPPLSLYL